MVHKQAYYVPGKAMKKIWDVSVPNLPPRNEFSRLTPIGIATPLSESCTSYISRAAESYHISSGALISEKIIVRHHSQYLKKIAKHGGTGFYKTSWTLNGMFGNAEAFTDILENLAGQKNLRYTTWLMWRDVIPEMNLLRKYRAWCPECFEIDKSSEIGVYERLLWSTEIIKICSVHHKILVTQCPNCLTASQPSLNRKTWPGYCSVCGSWLGNVKNDDSREIVDGDELTRNRVVNECVGSLIAAAPSLNSQPKKENVQRGIKEIVQEYCDCNIAYFARTIGVPRHTAWMWYYGKAHPRLEALVAICGCYSVDIVKLLAEGQIVRKSYKTIGSRSLQITAPPKRERKSSINLNDVKAKLRRITKNQGRELQSMEAVSKELGHSKRLLYQHFPELCKQISISYRRNIELQSRLRISRGQKEIRRAVADLKSCGMTPRYSSVRNRLSNPSMLREKAIRAEWFKAKKDI